MKIYKVEFEVDEYKSLLASDDSVYQTDLLTLDGSSKSNEWKEPLSTELDNLGGKDPDIFGFNAGDMVLYGESYKILNDYINKDFELLPVQWGSKKGFCINPLILHNSIDSDNSTWCVDEDSGKKLFLEEYVFDVTKVPDSFVFKDTLDCFELFTTDQEGSLKIITEKSNLKGLSFELLHES